MTEIKLQKPPVEFFNLLDQIINNEENTRDCFDKAVKIAQDSGFTDTEIANFMRNYCKNKIPKTTLWRWTKPLVPTEQNDDKNDTDKSDIDQGFISEDEDIPPKKVWTEDKEELKTTKKQVVQLTEDNKAKDERIEELTRRTTQLEQVVKKDAFKTASEVQGEKYELTVDGLNTEYFKSVKLERILPDLVSPLRNRGWKKAEFWARVIRE